MSPRLADLLDTNRIVLHPFVLGEITLGAIASRAEVLEDLRSLRTTSLAQPDEVFGLIERPCSTGFSSGLSTDNCTRQPSSSEWRSRNLNAPPLPFVLQS
jgi:hypothetical protein